MKHFLEISQLSADDIHRLIQRALYFKTISSYPVYDKSTVAHLFYEHSTRTRASFDLAAKKLGMPILHFDVHQSAEKKGEVVGDTVRTLAAMGVSILIIRHAQNGLPHALSINAPASVHIMNAGDGNHAHPSQALLDFMTIIEQKPALHTLKVAIMGDIRHSRVANSLQVMCQRLQIGSLSLIAPPCWQPTTRHYGTVTDSLQEGLADADVIICLRVQRERLMVGEEVAFESYRQGFALTEKSLAYAKPDVMVMHPGPLNRGVEIDSEVADGAHSFILQQVQNGVFMRMAMLESLVN